MTPDGYPDDQELELIEKWDYKDAFALIEFIRERWAYDDYFKTKWTTDRAIGKYTVLKVNMSTAGWSGNEEIIRALEKNEYFFMLFHESWRKGGHYVFEIDPIGLGYKTTKKICESRCCSRQYIHKIKDQYDWIKPDGKPPMGRPKKTTA